MTYDLICLSHLRWDFVYQRPQHLMARAAKERQVLYVEEPITTDGTEATLSARPSPDGVTIVVPAIPAGMPAAEASRAHAAALRTLAESAGLQQIATWYYTPMSRGIAAELEPVVEVYDCMDELSAFAGAPAGMREQEAALMARMDVVFTGGRSLHRAKRHLHSNMHCLPSAVDHAHFAAARGMVAEPADQANIPRPGAGFFGVIDERMDLALLAQVAALRPELQIVMIGPVTKIDPAMLPRAANLHWLGGRTYAELPSYIAGWDVALLPFARNQSTRFISPTKTPEYLAAGRPVVSTSIHDVVHPYGMQGLARIADRPEAFALAIDSAMEENARERRRLADRLLAHLSWDETWAAMDSHVMAAIRAKRSAGAGRAGHTPWRRRPSGQTVVTRGRA